MTISIALRYQAIIHNKINNNYLPWKNLSQSVASISCPSKPRGSFFSSTATAAAASTTTDINNDDNNTIIQPDPLLVDARDAPFDFLTEHAVVYRDFITPKEGELISKDILSRLKRRRYEKGHWDAVITNYKEVELSDALFADDDDDDDDDKITIPKILEKTREHLGRNHIDYFPINWLPCHAIDLKKEGQLNAHVDSVKFSGDLVAGISLLSPSIMRLIPDDDENDKDNGNNNSSKKKSGKVDLYLPPLSLYALTGPARYRYSHQLLPDNSIFTNLNGEEVVVKRDHRLSIIFRDAKPSHRA